MNQIPAGSISLDSTFNKDVEGNCMDREIKCRIAEWTTFSPLRLILFIPVKAEI
jgi:hypothetical protein